MAQAYHPGQGVYRSSYQNAMRMARTEINSAYREADSIRWQQLDFIVGYEVKTSKSHVQWLAKFWYPRFKKGVRRWKYVTQWRKISEIFQIHRVAPELQVLCSANYSQRGHG